MNWRLLLSRAGIGLLIALVAGLVLGLMALGGTSAFAAGRTVDLWGFSIDVLEICFVTVLFCASWLVVLGLMWFASQRAQQILEELRHPRRDPFGTATKRKPPEYAAFVAASAAVPIGLMTKQLEEDVVTSLVAGTTAFFVSLLATTVLKSRPMIGLLLMVALAVGCLAVTYSAAGDPWGWFRAAETAQRMMAGLLVIEIVGVPCLVAWLELQRPVSNWQFLHRFAGRTAAG